MGSSIEKLGPLAAPIGRALLAFIFILAGLQKITGYTGTQGYMEAMGVSGTLLPLVIAVEVLVGLALLLGWQARAAAVLLGGFSIVSGLLFHLIPSFGMDSMAAQAETVAFMKNLAIAGGMGIVFSAGAGAYSLDSRRASLA